MTKLTPNEKKVLKFLWERHEGYYEEKNEQFCSPTKIGEVVGGKTKTGTIRHSSWASPICKKLVEKGFAVRGRGGWYRLNSYMTAEKVKEALKCEHDFETQCDNEKVYCHKCGAPSK